MLEKTSRRCVLVISHGTLVLMNFIARFVVHLVLEFLVDVRLKLSPFWLHRLCLVPSQLVLEYTSSPTLLLFAAIFNPRLTNRSPLALMALISEALGHFLCCAKNVVFFCQKRTDPLSDTCFGLPTSYLGEI